jgi:1-acyl-sn-glycerol-3-phosphate acyltransferase
VPYHFTPDGRLSLNVKANNFFSKMAVETVMALIRYPLRLDRFERAARNLFSDQRPDVPFWIRLSEAYEQDILFDEALLAGIPETGPLVIVANHPLNGVEGLAIGALLSRVRRDVKIALTPLLAGIPGIADHAFFLNPYGGPAAIQQNLAVRDRLKQFVIDGGALIMFPSGEVSGKKKLSDEMAVDGDWKAGTAKLLKSAPNVKVVPIFVGGVTSQAFQVARKIQNSISNSALQMAIGLPMHAREISSRMGADVELILGPPLSAPELLSQFENPLHMMAKLKEITYALGANVDVATAYSQFLAAPTA